MNTTIGEWVANGNYIGIPYVRISHINGSVDEETDEANAAFIVKACNNHSALIEALQNTVNQFRKVQPLYSKDVEILETAEQLLQNIQNETK